MIVRILGFIGYLTHLFSLFPLLWPTIIVKILKFMFFFSSGWYDGGIYETVELRGEGEGEKERDFGRYIFMLLFFFFFY